MKLLDVNLLIYVGDEQAREHEATLRWFEEVLSGTETVAFAWFALLGFLRITTRSQGARDPWPIESALDEIQRWLAQPVATVIHPTNRFLLYALYPECQVSIHVLWGLRQQNTVFATGKSIIDRSSKTNVGELMLSYGGGGHEAAGTCQIANEDAAGVLGELIARINHDG